MKKDTKELFVPGRLCLFGEHSDWADKYRTINANIVARAAIVSGIEQGIYATVERDSHFSVTSTAPEIKSIWQAFSCRMDAHELKDIAKSGSFFCYCAGVASYMLEWYKVGGVKINITKMTLPIKSGLSSSAAICVLVARAFNLIYNLNLSTMGEMNIAYWGELRTSSRWGRLDQACAFGVHPVLMTFDAEEVDVKNFNISKPLYWIFSDLNGEKDTIKILADLNKAFPFAESDKEKNVQYALGELNQQTIEEAIELMRAGDAENLGKLMTKAQADFDKYIAPMCPSQLPDTIVKRKSLLTRFLDYFNDANKNKKHKKFDFSVIGGPHYNSDIKLGLGLVAAGLYRTCPTDTLLPPSNVSLFSDVSTVGFYLLGIRGTNIFPQDKYPLKSTVYFLSFPSGCWGIGFDNCDDDKNGSQMKRWQARLKASFAVKLADNLYLGPMFAYDYIHSTKVTRPELMNGQDMSVWNLALGFQLMYDSRDVLTNPHRGYYLDIEQYFRPKFLGNKYAFTTTEIQSSVYARLWKGAILGHDFRASRNFGNPSWAMMALFGSSNSMRGSYDGRYRDNHKFETQIELRQHVWKRNGVVLWGGFGTVFSKFSNRSEEHTSELQ